MKKLLLLFISVFFALGTTVAEDKKDETKPAEFGLSKANPADGASIMQSVYNISLEFTKDVEATLPEGGIEVKNEAGDVVFKLTSFMVSEYIPKNTVILLFEQKLIVDEKEGEKWVDQWIEAPGKYSYTIPAGCIKSVDGEEFPEQTFTFTIASELAIENISPAVGANVEKLENITFTFAEEIAVASVNNMAIVDNYWTPVAFIKSAVIGEDKKSVTLELESPITNPGTYNLDIYPSTFVSVNGNANAYKSIYFNVVSLAPSYSLNYNDGDRVKEIGNLEITFENVKNVELVEGAKDAKIFLPNDNNVNGTAVVEGNKITISFDADLTAEGEYIYTVPAGYFKMDGVENEKIEVTVELYKFTIESLAVVSVTPVEGAVEQIEKIIIEFNQKVQLSMNENWQQISREIKLTSGDKEYTLTYNPTSNAGNKLEYLVNAEWNGYEYAATPVVEEGTYTLNLADIVVDHAAESYIDEWGYNATKWHSEKQSVEGTYSWTIAAASIDNIELEEGEQVIYDLTGRRVEKINNAGIYIVNGKKVIVK